jgi:hypothetical protein
MRTRADRFWIQIVGLSTGIACGVALLIATLGAATGAAAGADSGSSQAPDASTAEQAYEGLITDTRCGAKHKPSIAKSAADCARVCVHGGAQFALIDGDKAFVLDGDLALLKRIAGQRARVVGILNGNTITVSSVAPTK